MTEDDTFNKLKRKPLRELKESWLAWPGVGHETYCKWLESENYTLDEYNELQLKNDRG